MRVFENDFSNMDLDGIDLSESNLSNVNFRVGQTQ